MKYTFLILCAAQYQIIHDLVFGDYWFRQLNTLIQELTIYELLSYSLVMEIKRKQF